MTLTTPKAVLLGFVFIALAIASLPYSVLLISDANAEISSSDLYGIRSSLSSMAQSLTGICREVGGFSCG